MELESEQGRARHIDSYMKNHVCDFSPLTKNMRLRETTHLVDYVGFCDVSPNSSLTIVLP